ncbi:MAG: hypothetical protein J0M07_09145 [Anaerolineae bacterium]|nr:hypothetical protein [Anaerolineae bacterium]
MPKAIPPRQPISDTLDGAIVGIGGLHALTPRAFAPDNALLSGLLTVRYAVRFLGKPHLSIVPELVAVDYGDMFVGEEAWDFILNKSNLYPRAEVFGHLNSGQDEMMYVKHLDLVQPIEVLVYAKPADSVPAGRPIALIAPEAATATLPPRLLQHLPRFATLADWQDSF